ncbi:hypothetical protein ACTXT7_012264, partial [Hymenolepis weldensis]
SRDSRIIDSSTALVSRSSTTVSVLGPVDIFLTPLCTECLDSSLSIVITKQKGLRLSLFTSDQTHSRIHHFHELLYYFKSRTPLVQNSSMEMLQ